MQRVIKQYPIYCTLCRIFLFFCLSLQPSLVPCFWGVLLSLDRVWWLSGGKKKPRFCSTAEASEWCWPARSFHVDVCVVSGTALCGMLHKSRLISMRRAHRRKMRGSDAEREARRKRQCNIRLEGVKIDEINLIYSFFLPQKLAYSFGGVSICATSL